MSGTEEHTLKITFTIGKDYLDSATDILRKFTCTHREGGGPSLQECKQS